MDSEAISQSYGHPHSNETNKDIPLLKNRRSSVFIESTTTKDYFYQSDYKYSSSALEHDIKPTSSFSTPSIPQHEQQEQQQTNPKETIDPTERIQFLREMEQAREELAEFRKNMAGLIKQMDGIAVDLEKSKDRVYEIEQDLTATEEVNVNLQVLLERAVKTQKESDVFATQAIRNMYNDLAAVVYENNQLQGRLKSIETQQNQQKGSVHDIVKRMFEYTQMLEQAQGTIHLLQEPRLVKISNSSTTYSSNSTSLSRRNSLLSFYDDDEFDNLSLISTASSTKKKLSNYIQSPPLGPQQSSLKPQQGLRMLFDSHSGNQLGLSSLARKS